VVGRSSATASGPEGWAPSSRHGRGCGSGVSNRPSTVAHRPSGRSSIGQRVLRPAAIHWLTAGLALDDSNHCDVLAARAGRYPCDDRGVVDECALAPARPRLPQDHAVAAQLHTGRHAPEYQLLNRHRRLGAHQPARAVRDRDQRLPILPIHQCDRRHPSTGHAGRLPASLNTDLVPDVLHVAAMSFGGLISQLVASRPIGGVGRAKDRRVRVVVPRRVAEDPDSFFADWDDAMDANLAAVIATQDAVILGRRSYTEWAQFWPSSQIQPFATFINGVTKYVATSTPLDRDWANATVLDGGLVEFVRDLKPLLTVTARNSSAPPAMAWSSTSKPASRCCGLTRNR